MKQAIDGVIGALDGSHIPICAPAEAPEDYVNRKFFSSIILQAIGHDRKIFMDVYIGWPGIVYNEQVHQN
jgi:hypothetical protein